MASHAQTHATHTRWFPPVHFFLLPVFSINFFGAAWIAVTSPSGASIWAAVMAFALIVFVFASRIMALAVQDRVIRLEERLRMREILPAELQPRIGEITRDQFVALRFAGDGELPDLVRRVLSGELKSRADIKKAVTEWRGDHLRA